MKRKINPLRKIKETRLSADRKTAIGRLCCLVLVLTLLLALAGCGGGGSVATSQPTPSPEPTRVPPPTSTPVVATTPETTLPSPDLTESEPPEVTTTGSSDENSPEPSGDEPLNPDDESSPEVTQPVPVSTPGIWDRIDELGSLPYAVFVDLPEAPGYDVEYNELFELDYSNSADGYIMARYTGYGTGTVMVQVTGPRGITYTYRLDVYGNFGVLPLSEGSGTYTIMAYQQVLDNGGAALLFGWSFYADIRDEFTTFLLPNIFVNYNEETLAVREAERLTRGIYDTLEKIGAVYTFVIEGFTYDDYLAQTVKSGYVPNLDEVYNKRSGICFDYAAMMTAMLRSLGIPTRMVFGYTGGMYHAWITTWTDTAGWVDQIQFDGTAWKLMDPTFASSAGNDAALGYIGDGTNYSMRTLY